MGVNKYVYKKLIKIIIITVRMEKIDGVIICGVLFK